MCILLTHSSEKDRFGRSSKPSAAKSRRFSRFSRLSRDLRFVSKLAVSLLLLIQNTMDLIHSLQTLACQAKLVVVAKRTGV